MTVFLDANAFIYAAMLDEQGQPLRDLFAAISAGMVDAESSTAVIEEIYHLEVTGRVGNAPGLARRSRSIVSPTLGITDAIIVKALEMDLDRLGAKDRVHVATCRAYDIDTIVTADRGFDNIPGLRRIDPLSPADVRSFLSGS